MGISKSDKPLGTCHKGRIRGQNPGLEVSGCFPLHTDAGTRQIRRTKIHLSHVKYHHFVYVFDMLKEEFA